MFPTNQAPPAPSVHSRWHKVSFISSAMGKSGGLKHQPRSACRALPTGFVSGTICPETLYFYPIVSSFKYKVRPAFLPQRKPTQGFFGMLETAVFWFRAFLQFALDHTWTGREFLTDQGVLKFWSTLHPIYMIIYIYSVLLTYYILYIYIAFL